MRVLRLSVLFLLVFLLVIPCILVNHCMAQDPPSVPKLIEYIGTLEKANGSPYPQGIYDINFEIFLDEECTVFSGWSEPHSVEISAKNKKDIDGATSYEAAFSVILGSINLLDLIFDQDLYVRVTESTLGHENVEQFTSTTSALTSEFAVKVYDSDNGSYKEVQKVRINKAKDADTVDAFHASDTPTANTLLPLNGSGQFSDSVIPDDITINIAKDSEKLGGQSPSYYAVATEVQNRVTGSCGSGSSIRAIYEDGSVVCEQDNVDDAVSNPSGSYPSMIVGYASSAGSASNAVNADKIDSYHASSFAFSGHNHDGIYIKRNESYMLGCTFHSGTKDQDIWGYQHYDVMAYLFPPGWGCGACETLAKSAAPGGWFCHQINSNGTRHLLASGTVP